MDIRDCLKRFVRREVAQIQVEDGNTPYIENGTWWIDGVDTGVVAVGQDGVDGTNGIDGVDGVGLVVGQIVMWIDNITPPGWLLCDGTRLQASTQHTELRNLLISHGHQFGKTSNDPHLPDLRSRFPVGYNVSDLDYEIGDTGGSSTHTLTINEMPPHDHDINTRTSGDIGISVYPRSGGSGTLENKGGNAIDDSGGGAAHNNMPPYLTLSFIIYSGQ